MLWLAPYYLFFLFASIAVRLWMFIDSGIDFSPAAIGAFGVGFLYDICVFSFIAGILSLARMGGRYPFVTFFLFSYVVIFTSIAEFLFWDEFKTRFNFIAVDYLVYTHEVIGNIAESYPLKSILLCIGIGSAIFSYAYIKFKRYLNFCSRKHSLAFLLFGLAYSQVLDWVDISFKDVHLSEISRNGIYELFSAYNNNQLDMKKLYISGDEEEISLIATKRNGSSIPHPLKRSISGAESGKKLNVMLIVVESLSAKFLGAYGSSEGLTPRLDGIAKDSLLFKQVYAVGTRTVYGLAALSLGMPPLPGNSIVRRKSNGGLFSIGSVLRGLGYDTKFIYGGYGYFDNMNAFFASNGYEVVDRSNFGFDEVTFSNIWGVCDGDLFNKALVESDVSFKAGKPFLNVVMTTSNHRPYTYPAGKVDIDSGSNRAGAVKYTDYSIGEFIEKAKSKEWFKDTLFVIVADHTAGAARKIEIDPAGYHIPLVFYAPSIVRAGVNNALGSQIDVPVTILGILGTGYESKFYGVDLMKVDPKRAFISNYQKIGYMNEGELLVLKPKKQIDYYVKKDEHWEASNGFPDGLLNETLSYYQIAEKWRENYRAEDK